MAVFKSLIKILDDFNSNPGKIVKIITNYELVIIWSYIPTPYPHLMNALKVEDFRDTLKHGASVSSC